MRENTTRSFFSDIQARTEKFRHECEVRWIADFDTDAHREVYLEGVWEKRGEVTAKRLRRDVWEELKRRGRSVQPIQETLFDIFNDSSAGQASDLGTVRGAERATTVEPPARAAGVMP